MFRIQFIYFLLCISSYVCKSNCEEDVHFGIKRSAVCLIQRVAQHNHITAKFEKISPKQKNDTHFGCKLDLGTEHYTSNSTSLAKAKEKVSREAYALTKYVKPALQNKTCVVPPKSDISLLEEYCHVIDCHIQYSEGARQFNGTFGCTATVNGKSASGSAYTKKKAKAEAATNLLESIGRLKVIDTLVAKYNRTQYHNLEPTLRVHKIARVIGPQGEEQYLNESEVTETVAGKGQVKRFKIQVEANDYLAYGSGATKEAAKINAAINLLRSMNFAVTYTP